MVRDGHVRDFMDEVQIPHVHSVIMVMYIIQQRIVVIQNVELDLPQVMESV